MAMVPSPNLLVFSLWSSGSVYSLSDDSIYIGTGTKQVKISAAESAGSMNVGDGGTPKAQRTAGGRRGVASRGSEQPREVPGTDVHRRGRHRARKAASQAVLRGVPTVRTRGSAEQAAPAAGAAGPAPWCSPPGGSRCCV